MIRRLLSSRRVAWPVATTVAVALWLVYSRPPSRIVNNNVAPSGGHVVRGAIHVHSQRSDGGGTLDDIAEEANAAGLDFVVVTDHGDGTVGTRATYYDDLLLVEGAEISTRGGHYIAVGHGPTSYPLGGDAKGVVVPGRYHSHDYVSMIDSIAQAQETLDLKVSVELDNEREGWVDFEQLLEEAHSTKPDPGWRPSPDEITSVLFTSGSSGDPKGVAHSANTLGALNTTLAPIYGFGPDDVIFMAASLGFSAGLIHGPRLAIYLGTTLILQESWNAEQALVTMAKEGAAFTLFTPTPVSYTHLTLPTILLV